jgi:hypothetical protein
LDLDAATHIGRGQGGTVGVKFGDGVMSGLERLAELARNAPKRRSNVGVSDTHLRDVDAVEAARELPHGSIATAPDLFDDGADGRDWAFFSEIRTRELKRISDFAPSQIESSEHGTKRSQWREEPRPMGQDELVPIDRSELSSLAGLIEQVTDRITKMAEDASAAKEETTASELFAIERALSSAKRRLVRFLGGR